MSRIGNKPITIPQGVTVEINNNQLNVKGPKGTLEMAIPKPISAMVDDNNINVERPNSDNPIKALHGLSRSLIANCVVGVSEGFRKSLEIVGVGYRAEQKGKNITLSVMLSHIVTVEPPEGIDIEVQDNLIHVKGIDKQKVGQVSAEIRSVRPPNAYTGKGIRYQGEQVKIKPGKSARRTE
jgi:large subunit ribosomal protein L6